MIDKKELKKFIEQKRPTDVDRSDNAAKFYPSSADRWLNCVSSVNMCKGIPPEKSSKYASEGNLAHRLCEAQFAWRSNLIPYPAELNRELMALPDNGEEMEMHANAYCDLLERIIEKHNTVHVGIEQYVNIYSNKEKDVRIGGSIDALILTENKAIVVDFKYGQGRNVSADTSQIKTYLSALLPLYKNKDIEFQAVVYQPRTDSLPKEKTYTRKEIADYRAEMVKQSDLAKNSTKDQLNEGSWCFWCPARRTKDPSKKCPLMKKKENEVLNTAFNQFDKEPTETRDEKIVKFMKVFPIMDKMFKELQEECLSRLQAGEKIKGLGLDIKKGRRAWKEKNVDVMEDMIQSVFPHVEATKTVKKMRGITEIEKEIGKKVFQSADFTQTNDKEIITITHENNVDTSVFSWYNDPNDEFDV